MCLPVSGKEIKPRAFWEEGTTSAKAWRDGTAACCGGDSSVEVASERGKSGAETP